MCQRTAGGLPIKGQELGIRFKTCVKTRGTWASRAEEDEEG